MTSGSQKPFAHMVYFTLKDSSPAAQAATIESCKKYLNDHEGLQHFSVGARAEDYQRSVNNTDFHVALHLVFASEEAHDRYQTSPRHQLFIDENEKTWAQVQVFDALI